MDAPTTISVDLGEEVNEEFIAYWNSQLKTQKVFDDLTLTPHMKKKRGTLSFAVPDSILITIASTAGTTLLTEIVKTFWKELIEFVKKKKAENKEPSAVKITISEKTTTIAISQIDSILNDEKYIPGK